MAIALGRGRRCLPAAPAVAAVAERQPLPKGFGTIWTTVAVDLIGFGIVLPILPQYAERFGATATVIGLLVASYSLAQLVFAPVLGTALGPDRAQAGPHHLPVRHGHRQPAHRRWPGAIPLLFVGRIIDGASGGSVSVAQAAVADVAAPADRARLMGLLGAAFGVGFVAGPAIAARRRAGRAAGARSTSPPPSPFVNALVAIRRLPETRARPRRPPRRHGRRRATSTADVAERRGRARAGRHARRSPARDARSTSAGLARSTARPGEPGRPGRRSSGCIAVSFVGMMAFSGFEATFSLLTEDRFGLKLSGTGAVFTVIGLALVVVQVGIIGRVNDRLGESGTLRVGPGRATRPAWPCWPSTAGWATLVPALALLVLGQGLITPTLSSAVAGRAGGERGHVARLAAVGRRRWPGWSARSWPGSCSSTSASARPTSSGPCWPGGRWRSCPGGPTAVRPDRAVASGLSVGTRRTTVDVTDG